MIRYYLVAIPYINMTDQHLAQRQKEFSPLDFARTGNKKPLLLSGQQNVTMFSGSGN
jgi:hypothetical protein